MFPLGSTVAFRILIINLHYVAAEFYSSFQPRNKVCRHFWLSRLRGCYWPAGGAAEHPMMQWAFSSPLAPNVSSAGADKQTTQRVPRYLPNINGNTGPQIKSHE